MQDYLKSSLFLIFDCALFYSNNAQYKAESIKILDSREVRDLIDTIRKYSDRTEIQELLIFIEDKLRMKG